jgi:hypothetical protein
MLTPSWSNGMSSCSTTRPSTDDRCRCAKWTGTQGLTTSPHRYAARPTAPAQRWKTPGQQHNRDSYSDRGPGTRVAKPRRAPATLHQGGPPHHGS